MAKAWQHIGAIGRRTFWDPQTVLVVGAGPIGLLAALIGVQQGADTHVLDRATSGPKPALVKQRGASHHTGPIADLVHPDIVVECTGVIQLARQAMDTVSPGIICLTGVGSPAVPDTVSATTLATDVVLKNIACSARSTPTGGTATAPRRSPWAWSVSLTVRCSTIAGHAAGPRVTLGWVMTRPQSAATLAAG